MKFCNQDISKVVKARSFKLGQLIEDDDREDYMVKCFKKVIFFRVIALCKFGQ